MRRLLCVTAHPDDEAGSFGGSLLLYRERGVETYVICLTPGQAATHRGSTKSDEELSAQRRLEFAASCKVLNITRGEVLDYRDGALDRADFHRIVADLVHRIRTIRPQVIVTYGPEGSVTTHPDHSMAGIFATMAFEWAGRSSRFPDQLTNGLRPHQAQKLYYGTALFTLPGREVISPAPLTTTIEIGPERLATKIKAFKQHTSQAPLFSLFENNVARRAHNEHFHLVARSKPSVLASETDLFEGVEEEL